MAHQFHSHHASGKEIRPSVNSQNLSTLPAREMYIIMQMGKSIICREGATHFSILDVNGGYWTTEHIFEEAKKTLFKLRRGVFPFIGMLATQQNCRVHSNV